MKRVFSFIAASVIVLNAFELPKSLYKSSTKITIESNYEIFKLIQDTKKAIELNQSDQAKELLVKALKKAAYSKSEKNISQYDYLFANYTLLALLDKEKEAEAYKKLAKKVIRFLDTTTNGGKDIWEEGDLGKFQLRVYKDLSLNLAKLYYKESNGDDTKVLKQALKYVNIAIKFAGEDDAQAKELKNSIMEALKKN